MSTTIRLLALLGLTISLTTGCGGPQARGRSRQPLPFVVKLKTSNVPNLEKETGSEVAIPANYGDPEEFTRTLAHSLEHAGAFELVVTDEEAKNGGLVPDLEMEVAFRGNDFGLGEAKIAPAVFSTVTWLFAGHLAWLIKDRQYPNSSVQMSVAIREPQREGGREGAAAGGQTLAIFEDTLQIRELDLSFSERAQRRNWLLNIVVPPWWGDGDPQKTGTSLARKSIDFFSSQEADRITSRLPSFYFRQRSSFLVYDRDREEILIVSQVPIVQMEIVKGGEGTTNRKSYSRDNVSDYGVKLEEREAIEARFTDRVEGIGIGTGQDYFYYRIPVREGVGDDSWDSAWITATPENVEPCTWTVYRETAPKTAPQVATSRS